MKYQISIDGCDDSTVFEIELDDKEIAVAERLASICNKTSEFSCMPTMEIKRID